MWREDEAWVLGEPQWKAASEQEEASSRYSGSRKGSRLPSIEQEKETNQSKSTADPKILLGKYRRRKQKAITAQTLNVKMKNKKR